MLRLVELLPSSVVEQPIVVGMLRHSVLVGLLPIVVAVERPIAGLQRR